MRRLIPLILALAASVAQSGAQECKINATGPQRLRVGITADGVAWSHWRCHPDATYALLWDQRVRAIDLKAVTSAEAVELGYALSRYSLGLPIDTQVAAMTKDTPAIRAGVEAGLADLLASPPMYAWVAQADSAPCNCTKSTGPLYAATAMCPLVAKPAQVAACKRL